MDDLLIMRFVRVARWKSGSSLRRSFFSDCAIWGIEVPTCHSFAKDRPNNANLIRPNRNRGKPHKIMLSGRTLARELELNVWNATIYIMFMTHPDPACPLPPWNRTFRFFKGLRFLVKACYCFLPSLLWAMVLLAVFICIGALVQGSLLQDFILEDGGNMDDRKWIWNRYGTAYRALYTFYEITFVPHSQIYARLG